MSKGYDPTSLVITAGVTDLQVLVRADDGSRWRATIKRNNRRFHEALLASKPPVRISTQEADERLPELELEWPEAATPENFDVCQPLTINRNGRHTIEFECVRGALILVAPKLGHVWRKFSGTRARLGAVLIFTTRRDRDFKHFGREEPVALGPLLADWLRPLCPQPADVRVVEYLQGRESLEDLDHGNGLASFVARRIESALRQLHAAYPEATLTLAVSGGQPAVKEFVPAAARLYFPAERIQAALRTAVGAAPTFSVSPGPAEEVRTRRLALWHLRHGGFVEALGVALEFMEDAQAARWVRPLAWAADLINRNVGVADDAPPEVPRSLRKLAEFSRCRALIPAIRTEAALQGGHWPEAINWTLTFFDAILLDAIEKRLPPGAVLADRERRISFPPDQAPDKVLLEGEFPPLRHLGGNDYEYDAIGRSVGLWFRWFESDALHALRKSVLRGNPGQSPLAYRNINTHNRLTGLELENACETFRRTGLWATLIAGPGSAFLGQAVIRDALGWLLDGALPADLYAALVGELEARLLDPEGDQHSTTITSAGFIAV